MSDALFHVHHSPGNPRNYHLFLLLIPAIVFTLLVALLFTQVEKRNQVTLGVSTEATP